MSLVQPRSPKSSPSLAERVNRSNKPIIYGEGHMVIATRDTIVELHLNDNGSGTFSVSRSGSNVINTAWEAEKNQVITVEGLSEREKDRV